MKKSRAVLAAEEAVQKKRSEIEYTNGVLERLKAELSDAIEAVRTAQDKDDAALPQCRLVSADRLSSGYRDAGRFVIMRKTPGGIIIGRRFGILSANEMRFEWQELNGTYCEKKKRNRWSTYWFELADVPPEFMPAKKP